MNEKVQFMEEIVQKIFEDQIGANFLDATTLFKGFFFMFVYQDLIIREIVKDCRVVMNAEREFTVLSFLEKEYKDFIDNSLMDWINLMFNA